jgi:hypothetical protein
MAANLSFPEAIEIIENFRNNPSGEEEQFHLFHMMKNFPIPATAIALGLDRVLLMNLPEKYTLNISQNTLLSFEKKDYKKKVKEAYPEGHIERRGRPKKVKETPVSRPVYDEKDLEEFSNKKNYRQKNNFVL